MTQLMMKTMPDIGERFLIENSKCKDIKSGAKVKRTVSKWGGESVISKSIRLYGY